MNYNNYRNIARLTIEAETPIAISSGEKSILTDSAVLKDINGLPYIPGTSLSGVIRSSFNYDDLNKKDLFGFQEKDEGKGSKIIFSDAVMIGKDGTVMDGIREIDYKDSFYRHYLNLPIRHHASINSRGVVTNTGKFDEEIVYKGTRFCFEIEIISSKDESKVLNNIISLFHQESMRFGGGTRNGFGKMKLVNC